MEYGLSSEDIPAAPGKDGKGEHEEHFRLCFDPLYKSPNVSFAGNNPICGSKARFEKGHNVSTFLSRTGEPVAVEIRPRSTFEIFNYLGSLIKAGDDGLVQLSNQDDTGLDAKQDNILFLVTQGGGQPCFVNVAYGGTSYCVPDGSAPNTTRILGLLAQLLALNTTINDLPATPSVRIVP